MYVTACLTILLIVFLACVIWESKQVLAMTAMHGDPGFPDPGQLSLLYYEFFWGLQRFSVALLLSSVLWLAATRQGHRLTAGTTKHSVMTVLLMLPVISAFAILNSVGGMLTGLKGSFPAFELALVGGLWFCVSARPFATRHAYFSPRLISISLGMVIIGVSWVHWAQFSVKAPLDSELVRALDMGSITLAIFAGIMLLILSASLPSRYANPLCASARCRPKKAECMVMALPLSITLGASAGSLVFLGRFNPDLFYSIESKVLPIFTLAAFFLLSTLSIVSVASLCEIDQ